jgi:hypothetical protein
MNNRWNVLADHKQVKGIEGHVHKKLSTLNECPGFSFMRLESVTARHGLVIVLKLN